MRPRALAVALAAAAAGCGGEGAPERAATAPAPAQRPAPLACRSLPERDVRATLRSLGVAAPARFEIERKPESAELSDCRYFDGDRIGMWLTIDRAVQAQKRYWYRMTEAEQFAADGRGKAIRRVMGVGQDATYGGAGAFWSPSLNRLMAYRDDTILVIGFRVEGLADRTARRAAARVARSAFRHLFGDRPPAPVRSLEGRAPHP
jgi:hypothetical protein